METQQKKVVGKVRSRKNGVLPRQFQPALWFLVSDWAKQILFTILQDSAAKPDTHYSFSTMEDKAIFQRLH